MKRNTNTRIFATIALGAIVIFTVFPMILLAVASFTDENTLIRNGYSLFPEQWSIEAYRYMRNQFGMIGRAYYVTFITTLIGTLCSMALTSSLAYPMARSTFKYRNALAFFVYFTMLFNGGIVPSYIMWTSYFKIKNTLSALIVPNLMMSAFNVMLVRNYYKNSIPEALYEAAQLDGASEVQTFVLIAIPLSVPVLSTVGLFVGLAYWNSWTNALYYVTDPQLFGIQNLLMRIMRNIEYIRSGASDMAAEGQIVTLPGNSIRMALALIGILPIIVVYPFVQKYFIKGVIVGAVKG
jgi:putative aldouronate transport system permease protein